jgi:hypothetical protein
VRLSRYFDGEKYTAYFGGAITGNMEEIKGEMKFSNKLVQTNSFLGPKFVMINNYKLN